MPGSGRSNKLEVLVQVQGSTSSVDSVVDWDTELRRMRVTLDGDADDRFPGRLMADFDSNRARIRDAWVDVGLGARARIRIGQFKPPFNAIEFESAKRLLLIERGTRIRGTSLRSVSTFLADAQYAARNRGIMTVLGTGGRWTLQAGAWLGSGEAGENDDGKEVAARIDYRALPRGDEGIPLLLAAAIVTNGYYGPPRDTIRVVDGDSIRIDDPVYGKALELSAELGEYGRPGLHALVGFFAGDNPFALEADGGEADLASFRAWQGWAEYRIETGDAVLSTVGPAVRFDRLDPDTDADDDAVLFSTVGVNPLFRKAVQAPGELGAHRSGGRRRRRVGAPCAEPARVLKRDPETIRAQGARSGKAFAYRPNRIKAPAAIARTAITVASPELPRLRRGMSPVRISQAPKRSMPRFRVGLMPGPPL